MGGRMLTGPPPRSVSVSCLRNRKGQTRSFLRSLPELPPCDSERRDRSPSFQSIPSVRVRAGLDSVSVRGAQAAGRHRAKV